MHIPAYLLDGWMLWSGGLLMVLALAIAVWRGQWAAIRLQPARLHLVAGGALCCLLLWLLNVQLVDSLRLHFLGVTTLTLVIGWSFTVLAASVGLVVFYGFNAMEWAAFPVSMCFTVLLPASATRLLSTLLYRPGLRHPFVYMLGAGFAGGALVVLLLSMVALTFFWLRGLDGLLASALEWWPLVFLLMFSEGFINGMCVSALAVFYPDWMKTFDERFYLDDH